MNDYDPVLEADIKMNAGYYDAQVDLQTAFELAQQYGVAFSVGLPHRCGTETVGLSADEVLLYMQNPHAFTAEYYGVTKEQLKGWLFNY